MTRKQSVSTPFGEVAYVERGEGPAAVFVHGVFLNSHIWRHVIDQLCGERRCIALDLLSHGDSPVPETQDISFRAQAEMLVRMGGLLTPQPRSSRRRPGPRQEEVEGAPASNVRRRLQA